MSFTNWLHTPKTRTILSDYAFLLPQLILYLGLTILPFIIGIPTTLTNRQDVLDYNAQSVGIQNYTEIFSNPSVSEIYWPALGRTVRFAIILYAMVYIIGMSLALIMYEIGFQGSFFTVIYLPWMISGLALGFMAVMLFGQSTGTINLFLLKYGLIDKPIDIMQSSGTTILLPILVGWQAAGFNMALFLSGLLNISRETIEASIVDGASFRQRLFKVYFPQMRPAFIMATIFCMLGAFGVFDPLIPMGALIDNEAAIFVSVVFYRYGFGHKMALAMTLALETAVPLIILAVLLQRLQKRLEY